MAARTADLPGLEPAVHADVRDAALKLFDCRADVTAAQGKAKAAEKVLRSTMEEHSVRKFFDPEANLTVKIEETERVVVLVGEKKVGKAKARPKEAPPRFRGEK